MRIRSSCIVGVLAVVSATSIAHAGFTGQPILGPLTLGSSVAGDNTGAADDNDGWFSGDHVFDIWDGGDDVYQLNWSGGDMHVALSYDPVFTDPDLFLYEPTNYDESTYDDFGGDGLDEFTYPAAPAGLYYLLIDTTAGNEGAYALSVTPEPAAFALLVLGAPFVLRRARARRR